MSVPDVITSAAVIMSVALNALSKAGPAQELYGKSSRWVPVSLASKVEMVEILSQKTCTPCRGGVPPLSPEEAKRLQAETPDWMLRDDGHRLERRFSFDDFRDALAFVEQVGRLADNEGHHPDVSFGWGYANISLSTKKIKGLHENDFIMASKIDRVLARSGE